MGQRGPIPKRSDERIRRNKDDVPIETIDVIGPVVVPELGVQDPHPLVVDFYESLKDSAQSRFYEPSDWSYARLAMHVLNDALKQPRFSAIMLSSLTSMLSSLLVTEGDRRRVRLEVERDQKAGQVVDAASMFRDRLSRM